ncbi:N-formylglutamate amidohydrolase, partial [Burkholderia pseudomallei]
PLDAPARRRHSIQHDVNRALYQNDPAFDNHAGFAALKRSVDAYLDALAAHVLAQLPPPRGEGDSR